MSDLSAYAHASSQRRILEKKKQSDQAETKVLSAIATSPFSVDISALSVPSASGPRQ